MAKLYRAMQKGADGAPETAPNARALGIRPGIDVPAAFADEIVKPGEGGLSVSPDDPCNLPVFRRPRGFLGTGKDPVWEIESSQLGPDLCYRPDPAKAGHGFIEPSRPLTLDEFQQAVAQTRGWWREVQPPASGQRTTHGT
jgi:hypothetical protein